MKFLYKNQENLIEKYGKGTYAIVTGSTNGIGLQFAKSLAKQGFNLICIGRKPDLLKQREKEIKKVAPGVKIINITKDFTGAHQAEFFTEIEKVAKSVDVSMLVNNVGMSSETLDFMGDSLEKYRDVITVNCCSQVGMLRIITPIFLQRKKNGKRSAVLDLSSEASCIPNPLVPVYAATKVLNRFVTVGASSYLSEGIDWLSIQPGFVDTNMTKMMKDSLDRVVSTKECIDGSLSCLGKCLMTPGARGHIIEWAMLTTFMTFIPNDGIVGFLRKSMEDMKKKILVDMNKKKEKEE